MHTASFNQLKMICYWEGKRQMRKAKDNLATDIDSALEIIELAASDFESLTKAFNLIAEVCQHQNSDLEISKEEIEQPYIH